MQQQQMEDDQRWLEQEESFMVYNTHLLFSLLKAGQQLNKIFNRQKKQHLNVFWTIMTKMFESDTSKIHNSSFSRLYL